MRSAKRGDKVESATEHFEHNRGPGTLFCNRKRILASLSGALAVLTASLHGDLPQSQRTETLDAFRDGAIRILVCSDVAARH